AAPAPAGAPSAAPGQGNPSAAESATLAKIRWCESRNNYSIVSASGRYRGAYQFDRTTWAGVGGSGDPAAASPAEQDYRALLLLRMRGTRPWPRCGR
ncbi:MAG: transglycosylase family protein, partial [Microthrixaceae bacterium]